MSKKRSMKILLRGMRGLCPRCGEGKIFSQRIFFVENCDKCGLPIQSKEGDCWVYIYALMAGLIGVIVLFMIFGFSELSNAIGVVPARIVFLVMSLATVVLTLPQRKGIALAIDYLSDSEAPPPIMRADA